MKSKYILFGVLLLGCLACQLTPPPIEEYTLARSAIDAARASQAQKYAAGFWQKADEAYRRARGYYQDHEYSKARSEFTKARKAAERAEDTARWQRQKSGDVL